MKALVIGGAGMIGRKLVAALATGEHSSVSEVCSFDVNSPPEPPSGQIPVSTRTGDLSDPQTAEQLVADRPELIFHLAAIVSGEAEDDFDKGYRINLDGTRYLLEAIRKARSYRPRLVFTSSIAVFGAPFPSSIPDEFHTTPLTSYGTQKAICELLLNDYSRREFIDGVGIRLPTICVRPGRPNKAASGFFSNIIREPLAGRTAVLPVSEDVRHWHASPRSAVRFLLHAASLDTAQLNDRRNLTMPGVSVTVGEQIQALRDVAGNEVVRRIRHEPDPKIIKMVAGWPQRFDATRATELGFRADQSFADIIRVHIEDELDGRFS